MNIEQAIEYWLEFHGEIDELRNTQGTYTEEWDRQEEATTIAIKALKRQTQMVMEPGNYCPKCGHKILLIGQRYCGQAIRRAE